VSDSAALKVDIRNAPIQEEDGDATAALALVANTLRVRECSVFGLELTSDSKRPLGGAAHSVAEETATPSWCQASLFQSCLPSPSQHQLRAPLYRLLSKPTLPCSSKSRRCGSRALRYRSRVLPCCNQVLPCSTQVQPCSSQVPPFSPALSCSNPVRSFRRSVLPFSQHRSN
jgi:hypothetical protein